MGNSRSASIDEGNGTSRSSVIRSRKPKTAQVPYWVRLDCDGHRVKIRKKPLINDPPIGYLRHQDEIEVINVTLSGFYQLYDGTVSFYLYFNVMPLLLI